MTRPRSRNKDMAGSGLRWTGRVQPCLPLGPLAQGLERTGWSIINIGQEGLVAREDNRLAQGDGQEEWTGPDLQMELRVGTAKASM